MATVQTPDYRNVRTQEGHTVGFAMGGEAAEAVCGVAAVVLAIIGLANPAWTMIAPIATIVAGGALLFAGAAACSHCAGSTAATRTQSEAAGGMSAEFLGGATGVVLGVLAILGIVPGILVSSALIIFGASLLMGVLASAGSPWRTSAAEATYTTHEFVHAGAGSHILFGGATIVLGILALVGNGDYATTLNLVGLLVVGAGVLMTASTLTSRMMSVFSH